MAAYHTHYQLTTKIWTILIEDVVTEGTYMKEINNNNNVIGHIYVLLEAFMLYKY
jgi:hypothetical protein